MAGMIRWFGERVRRHVRDRVSARMDLCGKLIVAKAEELVPVRTGKLKVSIGYHYDQSTMILTVYADMGYATYVEMGTIRMRAQPYIMPAIPAGKAAWSGSVVTTV